MCSMGRASVSRRKLLFSQGSRGKGQGYTPTRKRSGAIGDWATVMDIPFARGHQVDIPGRDRSGAIV